MTDAIADLEQADIDLLAADVSDEALEASAGQGAAGLTTWSLQFYTCGGGTCP